MNFDGTDSVADVFAVGVGPMPRRRDVAVLQSENYFVVAASAAAAAVVVTVTVILARS